MYSVDKIAKTLVPVCRYHSQPVALELLMEAIDRRFLVFVKHGQISPKVVRSLNCES